MWHCLCQIKVDFEFNVDKKIAQKPANLTSTNIPYISNQHNNVLLGLPIIQQKFTLHTGISSTSTELPSTTACSGFQCDDGWCIPQEWTCDRWWDCENGEEELGCRKFIFILIKIGQYPGKSMIHVLNLLKEE